MDVFGQFIDASHPFYTAAALALQDFKTLRL